MQRQDHIIQTFHRYMKWHVVLFNLPHATWPDMWLLVTHEFLVLYQLPVQKLIDWLCGKSVVVSFIIKFKRCLLLGHKELIQYLWVLYAPIAAAASLATNTFTCNMNKKDRD